MHIPKIYSMFTNIKHLLFSPLRGIIYILLVIFAWLLWWYFTDIEIIFGNYGEFHAYTDIALSMMMIFWFPLFLIAVVYRGWKFGKKENMSGKTWVGLVWGILWTIISGCSCCGLTLAAYFGFIPLMTLLPYDGLEIKILATFSLLYALFSTLKNLESCQISKK